MALQKQMVDVLFVSGLDKKTDGKLTTRPTQLDNAQFVDANTISKRGGFTLFSSAFSGGKSLYAIGKQLAIRHGSGMGLVLNSPWTSQGTLSSQTRYASLSLESIMVAGKLDSICDCNFSSDFSLSCAVFSNDTFYSVAVIEEATRNVLFTATIGNIAAVPRVVKTAVGFGVIYYQSSTNSIRCLNINTSAGTSSDVSLVASVTIGTYQVLDAINLASGNILLAYATNVPNTVLRVIDSSLGAVAGPSIVASDSQFMALGQFSGGKVCMAYGVGNSLNVATANSDLIGLAATSFYTGPPAVTRVGVCPNSTNMTVLFSVEASGSNPVLTMRGVVSNVPTVVTAGGHLLTAIVLESQPVTVGVNETFLCSSPANRTGFLFQQDTGIGVSWMGAGRFLEETFRSTLGRVLPKSHFNSSANAFKSVALQDRAVTGDGDVQAHVFTADYSKRINAALVDQGIVFGGGMPTKYDSTRYAEGSSGRVSSEEELGFNVYPVITASAAATGSLSTGSYQVVGVYEWKDGQGKLHRGIPSAPVTVSVTSGQRINVSFPNFNLTEKVKVAMVVYRTEANGSIFYRDNGATFNNQSTTGPSTIALTQSDATLRTNELLYSQSGELERYPCPAHKYSWQHQTRLFVAGLEDPYEVRFSTQPEASEGISFHPEFSFRIPTAYGPITGGASLDDKCIIATERALLYVVGEGPNRQGQGSTYSEPERISGGLGVRDGTHHVIRVTDLGMAFQSLQGIRLLNRGMAVQRVENGTFWGAEMDAFVTGPLVTSTHVEDKAQLRFFDGASAFVYDYQFNQWSRFTNQSCLDAVMVNGVQYRLDASSGSIFLDSGVTDNGTAVAMTVETGWIKLAGIQGFQRVYRLWILGTFKATSTLSVEVGYNYKDAYSTPKTVVTGDIASTTTPLEVQLKLPVQKCTAIRFRISESGGAGAGFALTGLSLEVGVKRGGRKLGTANIL